MTTGIASLNSSNVSDDIITGISGNEGDSAAFYTSYNEITGVLLNPIQFNFGNEKIQLKYGASNDILQNKYNILDMTERGIKSSNPATPNAYFFIGLPGYWIGGYYICFYGNSPAAEDLTPINFLYYSSDATPNDNPGNYTLYGDKLNH